MPPLSLNWAAIYAPRELAAGLIVKAFDIIPAQVEAGNIAVVVHWTGVAPLACSALIIAFWAAVVLNICVVSRIGTEF